VGEDNILFDTDFPHPTRLYPKPLETAAEKMSTLEPSVQRKILGENATKLSRLVRRRRRARHRPASRRQGRPDRHRGVTPSRRAGACMT
jgi:Amidohydrolase